MKGTIHSTQTTNGKEENVTLDISGQYAGPCDQDKDDTSSLMDIPSAEGLSARELAVKQKELDLRSRELEIKQKELELQASAINGNNKPAAKSALNDLNNAVTTTNSVKNTIGGLRSLLGR
jgi:hypothetical protein